MKKLACVVSAALVALAGFAADTVSFVIRTDHGDCPYQKDEQVTFTVRVLDADGALVNSGEVKWMLDNYGSEVVHEVTTYDLANGNPFTVSGSLSHAGFLRLQVKHVATSTWTAWSVPVAPEELSVTSTRPSDFDAYWNAAMQKLEDEVPLDMVVEKDESRCTSTYDFYCINFATFSNDCVTSGRLYGFYTVPKDTTKTYPVLVSVPGAGANFNSMSGSDSSVRMSINVLPFEPSRDSATFNQQYKEWNEAVVAKFGVGGSYGSAGLGVSREDYVFYPIILGINRAVNWLAQQPTSDLTRFAYQGTSQGGAFGLFLMGLNTHFTRGAVLVPAMCDHGAASANRAVGWPNLIANQPSSQRTTATELSPYFDGAHFASRITIPVRMAVGLSDITCPPAGGWTAFNALASTDKGIFSVPGMPHTTDSRASAFCSTTWLFSTTAPASPATSYTAASGATYIVRDHVLTITVPENVTNDYDYSSMTIGAGLTNVIFRGATSGRAMVTAYSMPTYEGDVEISGKLTVKTSAANCFGRCFSTYAEGQGTIRVGDGSGVYVNGGSAGSVAGKRFIISGTGPDGVGVLHGAVQHAFVQNSRIELAADAKLATSSKDKTFLMGANVIDVQGHTLSVAPPAKNWGVTPIGGETVFTNSVTTGGMVDFDSTAWNMNFVDGNTFWRGGAQNVVRFRGYSIRQQKPMYGDWTVQYQCSFVTASTGNDYQTAVAHATTNNLNYLNVAITSSSTAFFDNAYACEGLSLGLGGTFTGESGMSLKIGRSDNFHFCTTANTFAGAVVLQAGTNTAYHTTMTLHKDAAFAASKIQTALGTTRCSSSPNPYQPCKIVLDGSTAFSLPAIENAVACGLEVTGGAAGTTIASVKQANADGFTRLDTAATVAEVSLTAGTLYVTNSAAGAYPTIEALTCSANTTIDCGGRVLSVGSLQGAPVVRNGRLVNKSAGAVEQSVVITSGSASIKDLGGDVRTYVFTGDAAFTLTKPVVLERYLVVGGGGAGGVVGGGGGAGGALTNALASTIVLPPDAATVTIGAGGTSVLSGWKRGAKGGDSSVTMPSLSVLARGGAGGSGWNEKEQAVGDYGSGGGTANGSATLKPDGATYQGNIGGRSFTNWEYAGGGGGGGQGSAGAASTSSVAGAGGSGIVCDITGTSVEYAAGGGGGAVNKCTTPGAAGGESAGAGGAAGKQGFDAPDNRGGGGGGGGYSPAARGGYGGSGIVALCFSPCSQGTLTIAMQDGQKALTISPDVGTHPYDDGVTVTCAATPGEDAETHVRGICTGYTLETWDEVTCTWSEPVTHTETTYVHTQTGTANTRLTWLFSSEADYTHTDGTTFKAQNRVLTITIPAGVTNAYDYSSIVSSCAVTNIVVKGLGSATAVSQLAPVALPDYEGDFVIRDNAIFRINVANVLGKNYSSFEANPSTVTVCEGALIDVRVGLANAVTGQNIILSGTGCDGNGVMQAYSSAKVITNSRIVLADDAQLGLNCPASFLSDNTFDVNGHKMVWLPVNRTWGAFNISGNTFTNSSATAGSLELGGAKNNFTFLGTCRFVGGAQNKLIFNHEYSYRLQGLLQGDWTLEYKRGYCCYGLKDANESVKKGWYGNACSLALLVTGTMSLWDDSYAWQGRATTFTGDFSGSGSIKIDRCETLHIGSKASTYAGTVTMKVGTNTAVRTTIVLLPDAVFHAAKVQTALSTLYCSSNPNPYTRADFEMDGSTVYTDLPPFENAVAAGLNITGGAAGSTIAAVTQSNAAGSTTLDTPATIGTLTLSGGSVTIGSRVPTVTTLVGTTGTTLNLSEGQTLAVGTLDGATPTVVGGGHVTVSNWKMTYLDVPMTVDLDSYQFAEGATVPVTYKGGSFPAGNYTIAYLAPGSGESLTASSFICPIAEGMTGTVSIAAVEKGEYANWRRVTLTVVPNSLPEGETLSNVDGAGTQFSASRQTMTITVPAGVTCTSNYVAFATKHYVTNIVLNGQGTYQPPTGSTYRGDWDVRSGTMQVATGDAFGAVIANNYESQVFVRWGARVVVSITGNSLSHYRTIHLAGKGQGDDSGVWSYTYNNNFSFHGTEHTHFILDEDATMGLNHKRGPMSTSTFDLNGHDLTLTGKEKYGAFCCKTVNSSSTAAKVRMVSGSYTKYQVNIPSMEGGAANEFSFEAGRLYLLTAVSGYDPQAWSLAVRGGDGICPGDYFGLNNLTHGWAGPVRIEKNILFAHQDGDTPGHALTFWGPLQGDGSCTVEVAKSYLHLCSPSNTFAGTFNLTGGSNDANRRNTLAFVQGGNACGKLIQIQDSDLVMDDAVDRTFPKITVDTSATLTRITHKSTGLVGFAKIQGGTVGTTIEELISAGTNTFLLDTPATIGALTVNAGTLSLSTNASALAANQLPNISNATFAAETILDMQNHALAVVNWQGAPTITNAAALTVTGTLTIDGATGTLATSGAFALSEGASLAVTHARKMKSGALVTLVRAEGGITLPAGGMTVTSDRGRGMSIPATLSADGKSLQFVNCAPGMAILVH